VEHPVLGTVVPSADTIVWALVVQNVIRRQPSGANVLSLSEQVPSRIVFFTDSHARKVKIEKQFLGFHCPR
jgi:hypothetical protein